MNLLRSVFWCNWEGILVIWQDSKCLALTIAVLLRSCLLLQLDNWNKRKNNAMERIHLQEDKNGVHLPSKKPFVNLEHVVGICSASSIW